MNLENYFVQAVAKRRQIPGTPQSSKSEIPLPNLQEILLHRPTNPSYIHLLNRMLCIGHHKQLPIWQTPVGGDRLLQGHHRVAVADAHAHGSGGMSVFFGRKDPSSRNIGNPSLRE